MRTDRQTDTDITELTVACRNFMKAPKSRTRLNALRNDQVARPCSTDILRTMYGAFQN